MDLFDHAESREAHSGRSKNSMRLAYEKFDAQNPHVWELFKRFTFDAIKSGKRNFSISLITERIRWEVYVITKGDDEFKINNNYRAFYARKFMKQFPEWDGLFRTRSSLADE